MKKTYKIPTNKKILLDEEFCNSITGSKDMPIDDTPGAGQIGGGMTRKQDAELESIWD